VRNVSFGGCFVAQILRRAAVVNFQLAAALNFNPTLANTAIRIYVSTAFLPVGLYDLVEEARGLFIFSEMLSKVGYGDDFSRNLLKITQCNISAKALRLSVALFEMYKGFTVI
jgi:hypothetical protein